MQIVQAGLKAIYVSGWQVAGDFEHRAADLSRSESISGRQRANPRAADQQRLAVRDQIRKCGDRRPEMPYWYAPLVADAEAGFGGVLNAFELMKAMIEAGAAGVHFEDQLSSSKKCGHMGGKVLVPTQEAIGKLIASRLAADVLDVPTLIVARTDARAATLLTSDIDRAIRSFSPASGPWRASSCSAAASTRPSAGRRLRPLRGHGLV